MPPVLLLFPFGGAVSLFGREERRAPIMSCWRRAESSFRLDAVAAWAWAWLGSWSESEGDEEKEVVSEAEEKEQKETGPGFAANSPARPNEESAL